MAACVSAVAAAVGVMGKNNSTRRNGQNRRVVKVTCSYSSSVMDPYRTLRIKHGATESEVKKAFRQLALQYHPDVCRGSNCGVQFHMINEAYDVVMSQLRCEEGKEEQSRQVVYEESEDEGMRGMNDPDWDMWEEWMGWEGAGIRDYSSHINPYI